MAPSSKSFPWRRWNNALHRDIGYFCVGLTIIYAVSGVAVNHVHHWNPSTTFERVQEHFEPMNVAEVSGKHEIQLRLMKALKLPQPQEAFRTTPNEITLFYDGWSVEADISKGVALVERPQDRPLLAAFNFLHLNHAKGIWTWFADLYAVALLVLALTGLFVLKGKRGLKGRGKWFSLAGLAVPILFIALLR